jgi:DNA polymerase-1
VAGKDLYKQAVRDFGLDDRDAGKTVELGLGYGMSAWGLARRVGISEDQARAGIHRRNRRYPTVVEWGHKQVSKAHSLDYVLSTMGRRVWVNRYARYGGADRNAVNSPVQTTAAEQTKLWQNLLHKWCRDEGYDYSICLAVHDEVVADVPVETMVAWRKELKATGIESGRVAVPEFPMAVRISTGLSWGDKKK